MKKLWKPGHSVTLSLVVTYIAAAGLLAAMICLPSLMRLWFLSGSYPGLHPLSSLQILFYVCCPAGWAAIISLLKLLHNICKEQVFTRQNIKLLRLLSWCFVFTALASVFATYIYYPCVLIFAAASFMAIILRVVKNVMEQATIMREEQELTI